MVSTMNKAALVLPKGSNDLSTINANHGCKVKYAKQQYAIHNNVCR